MIHELKIAPKFFEKVQDGSKTFEIIKDDRDYKVFDGIHSREYYEGSYTGKGEIKRITYILRDIDEYRLKKGFVLISIK